jgi:hypothetical protein
VILLIAAIMAYASAEAKEIDYDWLVSVEKSEYIPHWRRLFNTTKISGLLECGCGLSTKYFLDHAKRVISIEYVTPGYGGKHYKEAMALFSGIENWVPILYNADYRSNSFNNACAYQCSMHRDYALIDPTYLKELDKHFKAVIKNSCLAGYTIDAAFVNPTVYIRGDFVKVLLANKIPIVVAHSTSSDNGNLDDLYGWIKVVTPSDYVKIFIPFGSGTTFWINRALPDVIASIEAYVDAMKQLRVRGRDVTFDNITELADGK